jgi:DNA-binding LytR/AlgR family response regulator
VLVLEDEPLISLQTADMVTDLGGTVVGPFARIAGARKRVESGGEAIHLALLDVNLNGERSMGFARELRDRDVPVVFCTGYDETGIEEEWRSTPTLRKPFSEPDLIKAVSALLGR